MLLNTGVCPFDFAKNGGDTTQEIQAKRKSKDDQSPNEKIAAASPVGGVTHVVDPEETDEFAPTNTRLSEQGIAYANCSHDGGIPEIDGIDELDPEIGGSEDIVSDSCDDNFELTGVMLAAQASESQWMALVGSESPTQSMLEEVYNPDRSSSASLVKQVSPQEDLHQKVKFEGVQVSQSRQGARRTPEAGSEIASQDVILPLEGDEPNGGGLNPCSKDSQSAPAEALELDENGDEMAPLFSLSPPHDREKITAHLNTYLNRQVRVMVGEAKGKSGKICKALNGFVFVMIGSETPMRFIPSDLSHVINGRRLANMAVDAGSLKQTSKRKRLASDNFLPPEKAGAGDLSQQKVCVISGGNRGRKGEVIGRTRGYYLVKVSLASTPLSFSLRRTPLRACILLGASGCLRQPSLHATGCG